MSSRSSFHVGVGDCFYFYFELVYGYLYYLSDLGLWRYAPLELGIMEGFIMLLLALKIIILLPTDEPFPSLHSQGGKEGQKSRKSNNPQLIQDTKNGL